MRLEPARTRVQKRDGGFYSAVPVAAGLSPEISGLTFLRNSLELLHAA